MADTYLLPCPFCDANIEVTVRQSGQQTRCESCGETTDIPTMGAIKKLPLKEEPLAQVSSSRRGPSRTASSLFAAGLLLLVIGGAGGFYLMQRANSLIDDTDIEAVVLEQNQVFDDIQGFELWDTWDAAVREGLGEYQETDYVRNNAQGAILKNVAYSVFGLAGLGLLLIGGSFMFRK
ncbi:MAG: hypothetical protein AAF456_17015 [Planctomycetota bacterium]